MTIEVRMLTECKFCKGTGKTKVYYIENTCSRCKGTGRVEVA